jgi:DNA gyrase subunit A
VPAADEPTQRELLLNRLRILEALALAIERRDEVLRTVFDAEDPDDARRQIVSRFELDDVSAGAVLDLQLLRFTASMRRRVLDERAALRRDLGL